MPKVSTWNGKKRRPKTLDAQVALIRNRYPTICPNRKRALDQLYCVIGNGYEWKNGRITPNWPYPNDEDFAAEEAAWEARWMQEQVSNAIRIYPDDPAAQEEHVKRYMEIITNKAPDLKLLAYNKFYPLSTNYSELCNVPDDVQDDYLLGAVEVCRLIVQSDEDKRWPEQHKIAEGTLRSLFYRFSARLEELGVTAG